MDDMLGTSEPDESLDDVLEDERPGKFQHAVGQDALPEDNDTPAAPADPTDEDHLPDTHQTQDTGVDSDEKYQEG